MDQTKIIIESLLTGSQFEISISEHDKISIVKSNIQKILGKSYGITYIHTEVRDEKQQKKKEKKRHTERNGTRRTEK